GPAMGTGRSSRPGVREKYYRHRLLAVRDRLSGDSTAPGSKVIPTLYEVIQRHLARARDRQPQKQRQIFELVESEQGLERIDLTPLGRLDGHDHGDAERAGGNACQQSRQQENASKKLNA